MAPHPYDQISDEELRLIVKLVKDAYPSEKPSFIQLDRLDPPKNVMLQYLSAEKQGVSPPMIPRRAYAYFYINQVFHKALVNLTYKHIICDVKLPEGVVGPLVADDVIVVEDLATNHPICRAEIEKLCLPDNIHVVCDPWI